MSISANAICRYITFSVPKASLGTPASGWGFTVVLHGQDGFSSDQARGFQPTPQDYQFGVCAPGDAAADCSADPTTVPKAMDVLTPAGVSQADELRPARRPGGPAAGGDPLADVQGERADPVAQRARPGRSRRRWRARA